MPKGFFPVQDTGVILGISEAPQSISFAAMAERQQALNRAILKDPAVESLSSFIGIDGTNTTLNSGRIQINLKPLEERQITASDVIRRLQTEAGRGRGHHAVHAAGAGSDRRNPRQPHAVSIQPGRPRRRGAERMGRRSWSSKLQSLPELRDVASDQQNEGLQAQRGDRSRHGLAAGHHAADDRRRAVQRVRPAADFDDVHAVEPVPRRAGGEARVSRSVRDDLANVYVRSPIAANGSAQRVHARSNKRRRRWRSIIRGSFRSSRFRSIWRRACRWARRSQAIDAAKAEIDLPPSIQAGFQGTAEAFQASLKNEPLLILAALVTVYIVLGVLYESYIHPITILSTLPSAGVGAIAGAAAVARSI